MDRKKLRVLFLVNIPSPYRVNFFKELGKTCELTVLFERETSQERDMSWYDNDFNNFKAIFLNGVKFKKNMAICFNVASYLKKELFDIIIVGGYSTPTGMLAIKILKQRKIPFILNTDGGLIKEDTKIKYAIKKYFISSATYWLCTGEETKKYLLYYGAHEKNIFTYPFTSILEKDVLKNITKKNMKNELKQQLNISEDKSILSVGRFIHQKGFDVLLESCRAFPKNIGVYIIGGEPTEEYIRLKKEMDLTNVHFINFKSKDELIKYYKASDLFVLPTRGDVWGLVINEAMAHGLPVITTDQCVAGIELINNDENGFIIPANDSGILKRRIVEILENEINAEKMSIENLKKIKGYTIEKMAVKHINIFKSIVNKG